MKPKSRLLAFLLACGSFMSATHSPAATLYWDGNDTTANADGGTGTWDDDSTFNWDTAALAGSDSKWANGNNDTAVFPGVAGTVTLGEDITVGGLRFDTNSYIIDCGSSTLSFGASNNKILLAGGANATITGKIGGSGNFILGPYPAIGRTLTLNGTSTNGWSGTTTVNLGSTLSLAGSNQALVDTTAINLNGGGITVTSANSTEGALDRVNNAAITANGGTFTWTNPSDANAYAETIGTVDLVLGQTNFALGTNQAGGGSQTLTLSGLTRTGASNTSTVGFSAPTTSPNDTTNTIVVTGAAEITGGAILGPWATTGTTAAIHTDYVVYDASSRVKPAGIAATPETDWTNSSIAYTSSSATVALSGNRAMAALKNTGPTATITLSDGVSGYKLATNGILNTTNSALTLAPGAVAGTVTAPGTGGGQIYLNTGGTRLFNLTTNNNTIAANLSIDISAVIEDNGGPVTVVKTGETSVLRLTGANTYSGGTVVNAGILLITGDASLGNTSGKVTLNGGQLRCVNNNTAFDSNRVIEIGPAGGSFAGIGNQTSISFNGKLTGSGAFNMVDTAGAGGRVAFFNSTANEFTGAVFIPSNSSTVRFNSLPDSSGAGDIIFYKGGSANNGTFEYGAGALVPLILSNRSIQIINNTGTTFTNAGITNNNTTQPITIGSDLIAIGTTAKTLQLSGVAGPTNVFSGKIPDSTGNGPVSVIKAGASTWTLSGNNAFSGGLTLSGATSGSQLNINSATALGTGTFTISGGNNAKIDNTSGSPITNSNNNAMTWTNDFAFVGSNALHLGNGAVTMAANRNITVTASTLTVDGIISGTGFNLTKSGAGTLVLGGANAYTGATNINGGTLFITGATQSTSAITFSGGGVLGLTTGTTVNAASATVDFTGQTVTVTGAPTLASYTLLTVGTMAGGDTEPTLSPAIPGYELDVVGNQLLLISTGAPAGFAAWQSANGTGGGLGDDHDGDGVDNGTEFFIYGPVANSGFTALPGVVNTGGTLSVTWPKGAGYTGVYGTDFTVETSSTLADPWATESVGVNVTDSATEVKYTFPGGPAYSGKNFARLKVTGP